MLFRSKSFKDLRKDLRTGGSSLHGKTVTHTTVGHSYTVKRNPGSEHNFGLYDNTGEVVATLGGDSEEAAIHILKAKGYKIHD